MNKTLLMLMLLSISLNATRSLAKLEMACSIGNEEACTKLETLKNNKKSNILEQKIVDKKLNINKQDKDAEWDKIASQYGREEWKQTGLSVKSVLNWIEVGVPDVGTLKIYEEFGLDTPNKVHKWYKIDNLQSIFIYINVGIKTAKEAREWIDAGISIWDVKEYKKSGIMTLNEVKFLENKKSQEVKKTDDMPNNSKRIQSKTLVLPKVYASLGKELGVLQQDCKLLQESSLIPKEIQKKCKLYVAKVDTAFKFGYKLDSYIDSDNLSEAKLNKYLKLLRSAEEDRESLSRLLNNESYKARKQDNTKYYNQLILGSQINLNAEDYIFMMQHPDEMKDNPRYIQYIAMAERKKQKEELKGKKEKEEDDNIIENTEKDHVVDTSSKLIEKNGLMYLSTQDMPYTGEYTEYYKNKQVKKRVTYKNGKRNGSSKKWFENGQIYTDGFFKDDKKEGVQKVWFENGQIKAELFFKDDKYGGVQKVWFKNGNPYFEKSFNNDIEKGIQRTWYENGNLNSEINLIDGLQEGLQKTWYENGTIESEQFFKNGKFQGIQTIYNIDGQIKSETYYEDGKKVNVDINKNKSDIDERERFTKDLTEEKSDNSDIMIIIGTILFLTFIPSILLIKRGKGRDSKLIANKPTKIKKNELSLNRQGDNLSDAFSVVGGFLSVFYFLLPAIGLVFFSDEALVTVMCVFFLALGSLILLLLFFKLRVVKLQSKKHTHFLNFPTEAEMSKKIFEAFCKKNNYKKVDLHDFIGITISPEIIVMKHPKKKGLGVLNALFAPNVYTSMVFMNVHGSTKVFYSLYTIKKSRKYGTAGIAIIKQDEIQYFTKNLKSFFTNTIDQIRIKKKESNIDNQERQLLSTLMKDPYHSLGRVLHLKFTVESPPYKIYKYFDENRLQTLNHPLNNEFYSKMIALSDINILTSIVSKQEKALLKEISSTVYRYKNDTLLMDAKIPKEIFTFNISITDSLRSKIESFRFEFINGMEDLERKMANFTKRLDVEPPKLSNDNQITNKENMLRDISSMINLESNNIHGSNYDLLQINKIAEKLHNAKQTEVTAAFLDWAVQYCKIYGDILKRYKRGFDLFNNDIVGVIIYNLGEVHKHFMENEVKEQYIKFIEGLLDSTYFDEKLPYYQEEVLMLNRFIEGEENGN